MPRLLFEKTGNAIWISHLDLMRLFQRAFKRANLPLKHSQGYSPRPALSIALPMSVGIESCCEILDFELDAVTLSAEELMLRLNNSLVAGVHVLSVYDDGRPIKELTHLNCQLTLEYDAGVTEAAQSALHDLLSSDSLMVEKHTKNGITMQDIIPLIKNFSIGQEDANTLVLTACICCQNPTLNPMQIAAAIEKLPSVLRPNFIKTRRLEVLDTNGCVFR